MTQEELLTDLRHRLRTPLNHIIGYSELLLEDAAGSDPDSAAHLRSIRANAHLILSQIQHRLSPDKEGAAAEKIAGLRADITEPLDVIVATAGRLSQRLRGGELLDLLRINAASMDLFWFAQGNDIAGRVFAPHRPPTVGPVNSFAQPSRILVVDDDETNCDVLNRQLTRGGHTVHCLTNSQAATKTLREESFDLVLLDVVMPGLSGFDVLREMKSDKTLSAIPVIMMSALDELESAAHCIQMGAEDYLLKPVDPVLLRARLHSALERRRLNEDLHRFAFAASHDLQEPLRTVVSTLQLLERQLTETCTPEQRYLLDLAVNGASRMSHLISDLLAYSTASARDRVSERVDSCEALDSALTNLRQAIDESHATVNSEPLPEVSFDRGQLCQIFQNLVGNAIKYRGDRRPDIHISSIRDGDQWVFSVRDNGPGIDPQYFRTIFEPFRRLHGRDLPGTGLGLAICERIVQGFGGRMWVESEPGRGSIFCFTVNAIPESLAEKA